ncbi:SpoIIE family protein phosphatase [Microseira wollei]|uniref:Anti-sigma regulatory factor, serine/threonine protein kinase n=1 Tax=Microseira wollei NIES-4236 TaxID=2530354 RepID=A0AAV3X529_9CYAN|nr:SpoIIE family protein phosphatase [Microseira wollei]GET36301.1 putative anti-sigma regulatory factor, serine/threonine protein kinase [Microseira wollei NIES-4236]
MKDCIALPITETSQVGEARRFASALATDIEFNETERGKVAIIVTELANNLIKHAKNGEIILRSLRNNAEYGIEIIGLDAGPGMANIPQCLRDGFSTAGTTGTGLGAIGRQSTVFDIHSVPGVGTVLVAQLWPKKNAGIALRNTEPLEIGVVNLPKLEQEISGDDWAVVNLSNRSLILVADGLGAGILAAEAAREAVRIFRAKAALNPKIIMEMAHAALRSTRGAAVAIAEINRVEKTVQYVGIGNISGAIVTGNKSQSMVSYNGTVGHQIRKIEGFVYPWNDGSILIMHSDGLGTQWSLERYPGLISRHPAVIAGTLYRDFKRSRDDVTVLVAKQVTTDE